MDSTARYGLPLLIAGQGQKEITHNEALVLLDVLVGCVVERRDLTAPPGSAAEGQCWLVPDAATGEWLGKAGQLAISTGGGWRFLVPPDGTRLVVRMGQERLQRLAGVWHTEAPKAAPAASVAPPAGGAVVDSEARAAIGTLLDRMQALGLLAT